MLIVFTRAILIYIFLLIVMRLMGKKQLGELQPFEFAITLMIADLACVPMGDTTIPVTYGLVPIFTLFVIHLAVTKLVKHSIKLRKVINGKPMIVINQNGIDYEMINKLDMTVNDLLEALRSCGYFSPSEVEYAIVETNGDLSVMPKQANKPLTQGDMNITGQAPQLPYSLICEGKTMNENIDLAGLRESDVDKILAKYGLKPKDVLLLTVTGGEEIFLQPKKDKCIESTMSEVTAQ